MTPEAQRVAIAEACGWVKIDPRRWSGYTDTYQPSCSPADRIDAPAKYWGYIPDYLNDLNAMHEAEKVLTTSQQYEMVNHLSNLGIRWGLHATAAQRAEAFLRTLNLWKDND